MKPKAWANRLSSILNLTHGSDRFPVDVKALAFGFSQELYPEDAIENIKAVQLPGFEGALFPRATDVGGWNIFYNDKIQSTGRINYTLAHELAHYLMHRTESRHSFECSIDDLNGRENERMEREANEFAASLLMPLDDFRLQLEDIARPSANDISNIATRYQVSWTAACLRWLEYTPQSAILVVSRDDFVLWSRSSRLALKQGAFYRSRNQTYCMPEGSLAVIGQADSTGDPAAHDATVWFDRASREYCISSSVYDFKLSLIHLDEPRIQFNRKT